MKTKQIMIMLWVMSFSVKLYAQENMDLNVIAKEVNESVWKPFKKSYEARDWQAFNALHTDDVLRVSKWGIKLGSEYKEGVEESYKKYANSEIKTTIDFWLEHRIYKGEVGYYRVVNKAPGKESERYARFHVVLRKENGQWKIAQDWDTSNINGVKVTVEDFEKGTMLDL